MDMDVADTDMDVACSMHMDACMGKGHIHNRSVGSGFRPVGGWHARPSAHAHQKRINNS